MAGFLKSVITADAGHKIRGPIKATQRKETDLAKYRHRFGSRTIRRSHDSDPREQNRQAQIENQRTWGVVAATGTQSGGDGVVHAESGRGAVGDASTSRGNCDSGTYCSKLWGCTTGYQDRQKRRGGIGPRRPTKSRFVVGVHPTSKRRRKEGAWRGFRGRDDEKMHSFDQGHRRATGDERWRKRSAAVTAVAIVLAQVCEIRSLSNH
jgi:hypothetical protein